MKVTDYSKIADRYESNKFRHKIDQDTYLKAYIHQNRQSEYYVLDLACGTGMYLHKQIESFPSENVRWYGFDASQEMLEQAGKKAMEATFVKGVAENLPFNSDKFDFIVNNYAFHHFTGKAEALDEITRVLKAQGIFEMHNIAIHQMKSWWVYKYFPGTYFEDLKRFWDKDLIFHELSNRNFDVEIEIKYHMKCTSAKELLEYAENRDISVLTLIDEKEYSRGLELLQSEVYNDPEKRIVNDYAELYCVARKL